MSDCLYHYCQTTTAFSILQTKTIRLSPLSAANDRMEGRVFGSAFGRLVKRSKLAAPVSEIASIVVDGHADHMEGFAFCLSEVGDLLSQWRAYADDGHGIAIGFDRASLLQDHGSTFGTRFFELHKVVYGEVGLEKVAQQLVDELVSEFSKHGEFVRLRVGVDRNEALALLADKEADVNGLFRSASQKNGIAEEFLQKVSKVPWETYSTKPDTFREEVEWRLLRYRTRAGASEVKFQADRKQVKPFIECVVPEAAKKAIVSVTLGPRNESNINWVRAYLKQLGMPHVQVKKSTATSYR